MISALQGLWRKHGAKTEAKPTGSAYFDGTSVVIVKSRCWIQGPLYIEDEPHRIFAASEKKQIQDFLVQILTSPVEIDRNPKPSIDPDAHKKMLKVRSQKEGITRYQHVGLRVDDGVLQVTPSQRDLKTKSWLYSDLVLKEESWHEPDRATDLLFEAFTACK
ncbi:hypothetical protein ESB00_08185 [Oleiharenicola lentus]|uniref:Uncharacterized protein n=1 Tax=Oleiharenicola lentus TaxID=2508720 RepID=A0A4V1M6L8_9BACT|nr:hypothetical protein [Oleiharenicola lentus]RXK55849.1 hypothetical protein ESB00_08185 [Oleiharenicola lentus]